MTYLQDQPAESNDDESCRQNERACQGGQAIALVLEILGQVHGEERAREILLTAMLQAGQANVQPQKGEALAPNRPGLKEVVGDASIQAVDLMPHKTSHGPQAGEAEGGHSPLGTVFLAFLEALLGGCRAENCGSGKTSPCFFLGKQQGSVGQETSFEPLYQGEQKSGTARFYRKLSAYVKSSHA